MVDKDGNIVEHITYYKYEIDEINASGYDVGIEIVDKGEDELGLVFKAKNKKKTGTPPEVPEKFGIPPKAPKTGVVNDLSTMYMCTLLYIRFHIV